MRLYAFKCKVCGFKTEDFYPDSNLDLWCPIEDCPGTTMVRDYKAENVGFSRTNIRAVPKENKNENTRK